MVLLRVGTLPQSMPSKKKNWFRNVNSKFDFCSSSIKDEKEKEIKEQKLKKNVNDGFCKVWVLWYGQNFSDFWNIT